MFSFKLATEIKMIDTVSNFVEAMKFSEKDVLITNKPIFDPYLKNYNLPCRVIFQENYGAGEPNDRMINSIMDDLKNYDYDRVLAVGGGTVIDVSKVMVLSGANNVLDYLYGRTPLVKKRKLVVIPTTCGTGSEVTNIAILEDTEAHVKKGIVGPAIFPDEAVLVPELVKGLPYKFFAFSSIDALIHAIESYLAPASNSITELFAVNAIEKILDAYQEIVRSGSEVYTKNIGQVLVASTLAGIAFGNTGVGAVHAMSYPLGGKYHVAHGEANYAFLEVVLRKYEELKPDGKIQTLKSILGKCLGISDHKQVIAATADILEQIIPLKKLHEYGVKQGELEGFTKAALEQERLMKNNYTPLDFNNVLEMYQSRY